MDREGQITTAGRALAQRLGRVGLWTRQLDLQPTEQVRATVAELEELGWGSLWSWEVFGREALTNAGLLLGPPAGWSSAPASPTSGRVTRWPWPPPNGL